jgi:hypothetical protein
MVGTIGVPIVDYTLAVKNQDRLLAQFQKSPSYAQSVAYYRANIGKVTSVDALLNDRKLLTVALSAFQLESQVDAKGLLRKLLSEDPTAKTSLAQQLLDPRYKQFAVAFAALRSDGGTGVQDPNNINSVLAGYQTNEYGKWVSNLTGDTAVRQALFFQQTVQDTIDISDTGKLFAQFQQSPDVAQAVDAYKTGVAQVTSVNDLLNNKRVLDVALAAFNIDPKTVTRDTLQRLLTEPTTSPATNPTAASLATDPAAAADLRLAQFAYTFNTVGSDGGTTIRGSTSVNDIIARYQRNQFAKTLAANDATTITIDFGTQAASTVNRLISDFQTKSGNAQSVSYYQSKIGNVSSVDDLVNDKRLLGVALGAFNIDPAKVSSDVVRQLLTGDPTASPDLQAKATTLLQTDPDIAAFVKNFGGLSTNDSAGFTGIGKLFQQFQQVSSIQSAVTYFQNNIGSVTSVAALTGNSKLLGVALTAFGLDPAAVLSSTINTLLSETATQQAADPLVTTDARFARFIQAFGSLNSDGGAKLTTPSSIAAIVGAYQSNAFAQTAATNDPATTAADFTDGSTTINKLSASYAASSGVAQATSYYQDHIGDVTSVADLVGNAQLLKVALGAFNLDPGVLTTGAVTDLLSAAPSTAATTLTQQNPDVAKFVAAFSSLNSDNGASTRKAANIATITAAFQVNQFKQSVEARTEAVIANPNLAASATPRIADAANVAAITAAFQTNQFKQSIVSTVQTLAATPSTGTISTLQILGNATLSAVTRGALGLPDAAGALSVSQEQTALKNAGFDPAKLLDKDFLNQFIDRFLANAGLAQSSTSSDPLAALITPVSSDNIPDPTVPPTGLDLSFLNGSSSGGSVLDLFA